MSKKTPLSNVIARIQSNKSRIVPKEQTFARPKQIQEQGSQDQKVAYPSGEKITQDEIGTGDIDTSPDTKVTEGTQSVPSHLIECTFSQPIPT